MSDHTHVFCPGCREDSDRLAALREAAHVMVSQMEGPFVAHGGKPYYCLYKAELRDALRALLAQPATDQQQPGDAE